MGAERRSMVMPEDERRNTAYHESGHAVVAKMLPKTDPVHKVTIIPRGRALGVTMQLPERGPLQHGPRAHAARPYRVLFGGRIAEEMFMNQMTTGASNDFERATEMARRHGHAMGHVRCAGADGVRRERGRSVPRPLGHHAQERVGSDACRRSTPRSAASSTSSMRVARKLIEDNRDKVEAMAKTLLEWETLDAEQIKRHHGRPAAAAAEARSQTAGAGPKDPPPSAAATATPAQEA